MDFSQTIQTVSAVCTLVGVDFLIIQNWVKKLLAKEKKEKFVSISSPYVYLHGFISIMSSEMTHWKLQHDLCQKLALEVGHIKDQIIEANKQENIPVARIRDIWNGNSVKDILQKIDIEVFNFWGDKIEASREIPTEKEIRDKLKGGNFKGDLPIYTSARQFVQWRIKGVTTVFRLRAALNQTEKLFKPTTNNDVFRKALYENWNLPDHINSSLNCANQALLQYFNLQELMVSAMPINLAPL